jgi:hypothetical protein
MDPRRHGEAQRYAAASVGLELATSLCGNLRGEIRVHALNVAAQVYCSSPVVEGAPDQRRVLREGTDSWCWGVPVCDDGLWKYFNHNLVKSGVKRD